MLIIFVLGIVFGQAIPTQYIAAALGYPAWLGNPLIFHIYAPFEWPLWWFEWKQPLNVALHKDVTYYGPAAASAFALLPYLVGASVIIAIVLAILAAIFESRKKGDASKLYDSGGVWSGFDVAKRLGLLKAAGVIIGAFEEAGGRLLRYAGELGIEYIEPPGGGKSSFLFSNLLISLQDERARRKKFPWFAPAVVVLLRLLQVVIKAAREMELSWRAWTNEEKRVDPWGEEPVILLTDLKGEFSVGSSGYQHDGLKKRVEVLAPIGLPETYTDVDGTEKPYPIRADQLACYNPFWSAKLGTDQGFQNLFGKVKAIVARMSGENQSHWDLAATGWGAAVMEHLGFIALTTGNYEIFSPCGLMDYLSAFREQEVDEFDPKTKQKKVISAMDVLLRQMKSYQHDTTTDAAFGWERMRADGSMEKTRTKPSIFNAADALLAKDVRERSAVWSTFLEKLNLFRSDALRKYTTRSTFEWKALANDPKRSAMIYLTTPSVFDMSDIEVYTAMLVDDFLRDLTYGGTPRVGGRSVRANKYPALLFMEEAYVAADCLPSMEKVAGLIRGYGLRIILILQSWAQHNKMFNPNGREDTLSETFDVHLYGASKLAAGGAHVEENLGNRTQVTVAENMQGDRFGMAPWSQVSEMQNTSKEALLTAKEFSQMDPSEYVGIVKGYNFHLKKSEFYKNKRLLKRAMMAPKLSAENTVLEPAFVRAVRSIIGDLAMEQIKAGWSGDHTATSGAPSASAATITIQNPVSVWQLSGSVARVRARNIGEALFLTREARLAEGQDLNSESDAELVEA